MCIRESQHTVQVRGIAPELFQVAVCLIAGEGRRHHKRGMAEQIVLHVRLVNDLIFCAVEDAPDQLFIGDCTRQLSDGDLFQVDGDNPVNLPMPRRKRKGKQDVLFRKCRRQCFCLYVVAHKNDVLRPVRPQRCLLYTSPNPRDGLLSRKPSSACKKKKHNTNNKNHRHTNKP